MEQMETRSYIMTNAYGLTRAAIEDHMLSDRGMDSEGSFATNISPHWQFQDVREVVSASRCILRRHSFGIALDPESRTLCDHRKTPRRMDSGVSGRQMVGFMTNLSAVDNIELEIDRL
jgi:hypothetical protein